MTTYICKDWSPYYEEPCNCEYREVSPDNWEFSYRGPGYGRSGWVPIKQKSLDEIRAIGHNPVPMEDE
jgi:hypothetical protein